MARLNRRRALEEIGDFGVFVDAAASSHGWVMRAVLTQFQETAVSHALVALGDLRIEACLIRLVANNQHGAHR